MCDGFGRQAADLAQGQRDAGLFRQAGVAAGEDQPQPVVLDRLALVRGRRLVGDGGNLVFDIAPGGHALLSPQLVDRPKAARRYQPCHGVSGHSFAWPAFGRRDESCLQGILGQFEAAQQSHQRGEDVAAITPVDVLNRGLVGVWHGHRQTGKEGCGASGRGADSMAKRLRPSQSRRPRSADGGRARRSGPAARAAAVRPGP